jgi:cell wall assembly regulator SMI1
MKQIKMDNTRGPARADSIQKCEEYLGVVLPNDYRHFLLQYDGGCPSEENDYYPRCDDVFEGSSILVFFPLSEDVSSGEEEETVLSTVETYHNRIPDSLLPIADDGLGNKYCIGISGENRGKVFFWDHEMERDALITTSAGENQDNWNNITFVCDSFEQFIDRLQRYV